MSIQFFTEDVHLPKVQKRRISNWIKNVIVNEGKKSGEISFIFCSDGYLLEMNKKYLKHFYYTDVITFDYVVNDVISGDVFISLDRIRENSIKFNVSFENELNRVLVHGVLHLLGYMDKDTNSKEEMTIKENYYLKNLNDN
jgi:probable rRNA maturation factor